MNTTSNNGPLLALCPGGLGHRRRRVLGRRNAAAGRYGAGGPAPQGWRRPQADEVVAERLPDLERMLDELG